VIAPAARRGSQRLPTRLERGDQPALRFRGLAGCGIPANPGQCSADGLREPGSLRAWIQLVRGEHPADRLVVAHDPLLLGVECQERLRLGRRRRGPALASVTASGDQYRRQERAGAPVDSTAMNVLVTGASGFVGRALVDELRHGDGAYEVHPFERSDGDLGEDGVAEAAVAEARPDVVVHAAARIGVVRCEEEPELALRSNVLATAQIARAAAEHGARLAYVSSSDVYGTAVADEETPTAPASLYALTKWWGEQVARHYTPAGLSVLRLHNPYGQGVEPGQGKGALPTMLWQAERREPIPTFAGEARSWCWIGDAVRGIRLVLEQGGEGVFNVGSDAEPVSLTDAARIACQLTGAPQDLIQEVEPPPGRVTPRISVERLRALGWRAEVGLDEGMRQLLESLRTAAPAT
jgi:nucleoside-diphosphate-sugar epimerase